RIAQIRADQAATHAQLDVFLRATYKEQRRSLLEFLLDSLSFGDFIVRVGNLQSVAQQQDHLLSLLKTQEQQLSQAQGEQRDQLKDAQDKLSSTINNQSDVLAKAQEQEQAARTQLDQLEREAQGVAGIIASAEAANPTKTYATGGLAWPLRGSMEQGFGPSPY